MPRFKKVDWDNWETPSPEIDNWQPDPDSIPTAGKAKDFRFNQDPQTGVRTTSPYVQDRTMNIQFDKNSGTAKSWPTPAPRGPGPAPLLMPNGQSGKSASSPATPPNSKAPPITQQQTLRKQVPATQSTHQETSANGSPETASVTLVHSSQGQASGLPLPLARALDTPIVRPNPRFLRTVQLNDSGPLAKHEKNGQAWGELSHQATRPSLGALVNEVQTVDSEALGLRLITEDVGEDNTTYALRQQKEMLERFKKAKSQKATESEAESNVALAIKSKITLDIDDSYKRYKAAREVIMMEREIDNTKIATPEELMGMDDDEFDRYRNKVASAHRNWWNAENKKEVLNKYAAELRQEFGFPIKRRNRFEVYTEDGFIGSDVSNFGSGSDDNDDDDDDDDAALSDGVDFKGRSCA